MNDDELLQAYAMRQDEDAFAALVKRHLPLVYSAAMRQLRDPSAAQEAVQAVFLTLAHKGTLPPGTIVAGWLLRATRYVAANMRRTWQRRQEAERKLMENIIFPEAESVWKKISPELDEALVNLSARDRDAVTLRYFEQKSFREIGALLGLSEDSARKRTERALDKLRRLLGEKAKLISVAALAEALDACAVSPLSYELTTQMSAVCCEAVSSAHGTPPLLVRAALEAFRGEQRRVLTLQVTTGLAILVGIAVVVGILPSIFPWRSASWAKVREISTMAAKPPVARAIGRQAGGLVKPETSALLFQVVDAQTRAPISSAQLLFTGKTDQTVTNEAMTDAAGQATLNLPVQPAKGWECRVEIVRDGYVPKYVSWSEKQNDTLTAIPATYTAKLDHGRTIGGRLVNEAGQPIERARVVLNVSGSTGPDNSLDRERLTLGRSYHHEFTDTNGYWHCSHVPLRYEMIYYTLYHQDYQEAVYATDSADAPKARIISAGEVGRVSTEALANGTAQMTLKPGLVFEGTVVDTAGRPICGAAIVQSRWPIQPEYQTSTDDKGRFHLGNLRSTWVEFAILADGFATSFKVLDLAADPKSSHRFVLAKGARLRGRVVDENGMAIAGACIVPSTNNWGTILNTINRQAKTDEQGWFDWRSAPLESLTYNIMAEGYETISELSIPADGRERVFTLKAIPALLYAAFSGRVLDARSKEPIQDFKVRLELVQRLPPNDIDTTTGLRTVANGQDGMFQFRFDQSAHKAKMEIEANGYLALTVPIECPVAGDRVFDLELEPAQPVLGLVLTPEGLPAQEATVVLCTDVNRPFVDAPRHFNTSATMESRTASIGYTDTEGRFSCKPKPRAIKLAVAHPSGFALAECPSNVATVKIQLKPWGRLEGRLAIRNQPVNSQSISLNTAHHPGFEPSLIEVRLSAVTSEDGRFTFEGCLPANMRLPRILLLSAKPGFGAREGPRSAILRLRL